MSFRLFGVNVEIQAFFWVGTIVLGQAYFSEPVRLFIWIAVVLVSILVHEFGHALAVMRHRIEPEISLHAWGGLTMWRALLPLGRLDSIVISVAGPVAGLILGGLTYAVDRGLHAAGGVNPYGNAQFTINALLWVNVIWSLVNLLPVLPFDGGHVLEHALGPKRARLTAGISLVVSLAVVFVFVHGYVLPNLVLPWGLSAYGRYWWGAILFGFGAIRSLQKLQDSAPIAPARGTERAERRWSSPAKEPVPQELAALLQSARAALAQDDYNRALAIAHRVLEGDGGEIARVPAAASREALEIIAWTHLLEGRLDAANEHLARAKKLGDVDAALHGAILFARRDLGAARRVLEEARSRGDDRKEVVGPLIQLLIEQGEVARAAAVALDIIDGLSSEDARKMAEIAVDHRAYSWGARLFAALFDREREANDAYSAARALALDGNQERALEWLRKAVDAGFTDRARAWSDAALEALRATAGLESVLPRP